MRRVSVIACSIGFLAGGCVLPRRAPAPVVEEPPPPAYEPPVITAPPGPPTGLYALDEAVADALAAPLEYIGTGPWHGNHRVHACAYRNDRVIVVNVFCTINESKAFRLDVFSPTRGRARVYAEAKVPVSTVRRQDYYTFNGEAEPAPGPDTGLPPLPLTTSFAELRRYDEQRYQRFLPVCYGGVEIGRPQGGCLRDLAPRAGEWAERNRAFLQQPPEDWYRIVNELRALARTHGRAM